MLSTVRTKVRALIGDNLKTGSEIHTFTTSYIFTLTEPNVISLTQTTINGVSLDSGETATHSTSTNKVTVIGASWTAGDEIEFTYTYYSKYSNTELDNWIKAALVHLGLNDSCKIFEMEDDGNDSYYFEPTPTKNEENLIALITAILLNPEWSEYRLPNITIKFPRIHDKETKIARLVKHAQSMTGWTGLIDLED